MSTPPPSPHRWLGLKPSRPAEMRLVRGPDAAPCDAQPFPFSRAVVIATVTLAAGAIGARLWLFPVLVVEGRSAPPPAVRVESVDLMEPEVEKPLRLVRLDSVQPPAPSVRLPVPIPAVQPAEVVRPDWERPPDEPYDPTEAIEGADEPFPVAEETPKVAESPPKPSAQTPARRPSSRPRSTPRPAAGNKETPARVVRRFTPAYPRSARAGGIEGRVVLTIEVRPDGRVGSVRVASSSGSRVLDSAAISAVKRWSFAPATQNGRPVSSRLNVPFGFQLE